MRREVLFLNRQQRFSVQLTGRSRSDLRSNSCILLSIGAYVKCCFLPVRSPLYPRVRNALSLMVLSAVRPRGPGTALPLPETEMAPVPYGAPGSLNVTPPPCYTRRLR